jgi:membrane protease YdiL (CAAX protease family)
MRVSTSSRPFVFYAITLFLAFIVMFATPVIGEASLPLTMTTPAIATVLMICWLAPEGGFRQAIASLGLATPGLKAWPLAILGPALIFAIGLAILAATALTVLVFPEVPGSPAATVLDVLAGLVIGTLFALCEEVGWRGYMLPRMQNFGIVGAMLLVGLLHGVWHLPLMLATDYYHAAGNPWIVVPMFLLTLTLAGVFYGFLRIWTGSIWPVAVAHASANTAWNISSQVSQTKSPMVLEYIGGESGLIVIGGLLIIDILLIQTMRDFKGNSIAS